MAGLKPVVGLGLCLPTQIPLPRRLDEERPQQPRPTVEPVADVRQFSLSPRAFPTSCGGLFLFVAHWVRLKMDRLAQEASLPGSKMIPAGTPCGAAWLSSSGPWSARAT